MNLNYYYYLIRILKLCFNASNFNELNGYFSRSSNACCINISIHQKELTLIIFAILCALEYINFNLQNYNIFFMYKNLTFLKSDIE